MGQRIRRGDLLFIGLGAANRDPQIFHEPDVFKIDRKANSRHVAFGQGMHACPGAQLARLEGEVAFSTLASCIPKLELATEPDSILYIPGLLMRGLISLPVSVRI
jgi:cytochrome P450 PksS